VAFTAPTNTGIPTVTSYRVTSTPGGITATGASSPITVSGLTNGTSYTFTVAAINAAGTGPESASSNAVTPVEPNMMVSLSTPSYPYLYTSDTAYASDGSVYLVGFISSSSNIPMVVKYNSSGSIIYQRSIATTGASYPDAPRCEIDASDNLYVVFADSSTNFIVKINSAGTIQWTYTFGGGGVNSTAISGNTLYLGTVGGAFSAAHVISFNLASPSINWATRIGTTSSPYPTLVGLGVTSNYVFVGGSLNTGGANSSAYIARLQLNGTLDWSRAIGGGRTYGTGLVADNSDNFYLWISDTNINYCGIYKFDANYTNLSYQYVTGRSDSAYMARDPSGNIYTYLGTNYISRWNTSLSPQFATRLTASGVSLTPRAVNIFNDKMYLTAAWSAADTAMYGARYPTDGSGTGSVSFNGYTYTYANVTPISWISGSGTSTSSGPSGTSVTITATTTTSTFSTTSYTAAGITF
jgi:hypothetical protein